MLNKIKIIIADDHHIFRKGILSIVNDDNSIEVLGEASNGKEAIELVEKLKPDIALFDIDMPEMSGLEAARKIKQENIKTKVVILTIHKDKEYFDEAMELDIKAYVLKESISNDLIDCIKQVAAGNYYISPSISGYLLQKKPSSSSLQLPDKLTASELQILKMISQNKTNAQIAEELFRSIRTVENHRNNICSKLGLKGPHALLLFALEHKNRL